MLPAWRRDVPCAGPKPLNGRHDGTVPVAVPSPRVLLRRPREKGTGTVRPGRLDTIPPTPPPGDRCSLREGEGTVKLRGRDRSPEQAAGAALRESERPLRNETFG